MRMNSGEIQSLAQGAAGLFALGATTECPGSSPSGAGHLKVWISVVQIYNYEIFWLGKCDAIADLWRLSNSPCCRQSARNRMAGSQQEFQTRDFCTSPLRLTDRGSARNWGIQWTCFGA